MRGQRNLQAISILTILAMAGLGGAGAAHAGGDVVIGIEIIDNQTGEDRMKLSMPVGAVESMLHVAEEEIQAEFARGIRHGGLDIRKLYMAMRDADLSDLLEVNQANGEQVKIWKDGDAFHLKVWDGDDIDPKVRIELPLLVLDALFSGDAEEGLNLKAALDSFRDLGPMTLVEVYERDETIRIWLD